MSPSRRRLLAACAVVPLSASAVASAPPPWTFETVKVAEGVYVFVAPESGSGVVQGNVVLIAGDDGALLVDAGQFPPAARKMVAEVRKLTTQPVRALVNTHWHGDHLLADFVFQEAFPGLVVVAHAETRRLGVKEYADWAQQRAGFPAMIATIRERVASGKRRDGTPLTEEQKFSYRTDADALEEALPQIEDTRYTPAQVTFDREMTFHLGKREVRVSKLGNGNTPGDAVLYVPDARVLVAGDTVVYPTPYSFGSFHSDWIEVLNGMIAMDASAIVPGHGPVMKDAGYLRTLVELLAETRTQVRAAVAEGLTLEQTRARVTRDGFMTRLAGDDPVRRRAFRDFYLEPGVERAWKEAKGEPLLE